MLLYRALASAVGGAALLLPPVGAYASSVDRFFDFRAKQLSAAGPIILTDTSYKVLTEAPRDYSVAVLLTALDPRLGCKMCVDFHPEWSVLARSWTKGDKEALSRLLLGTLDFADGRETFTTLGLQTAPVLLFLPPNEGPHAVATKEPIRYDFSSGAVNAEHVRSWLARHLPDRPHPEVKRPFNWARFGSSVFLISAFVATIATAWSWIQPIVQSKNLWAGLGLTAILVFTSGHMFNQIRGVPYVAGNGRGGVQYFAPNFQSQYGLETQIVAGLYGVLAFCAISLATRVPRIEDIKMQTLAVFIYAITLLSAYSFLLSIFRIKNPGYPFSLPPFM
jgi:oligosaccharyltransferase complex subunit gamma